MDFSVVSVYDNVHTPDDLSKSSVFRKLNDLLSLNTDLEVRIFCPLCVKSFNAKLLLYEHLRTFHNAFLTQASNQTLKFTECPFCNAKFYGKHITAKHVLHDHPKVVKALFVNKHKFKCFFCNKKMCKEDFNNVVKHIEDLHFFDFEEEFKKMFSCDVVQEMSMSEFINTSVEEEESGSENWKDVCMKIGKHSGNKQNNSSAENFDEASIINCYDFTDLKQQLENMRRPEISTKSSGSKSILKDVTNSNIHRRSARRVLRFDLPSECEDKEIVVHTQNFSHFKPINVDEQRLLCSNKPSLFFKINETFCEQPQHSSTPNSRNTEVLQNKKTKRNVKYCRSNFKSYITDKKISEFEFQCGKCRLLFKENLDLVSHVKNNHKKFSLNAFQPCYHCAICHARFYRNCYLRKHHNLHKPY